MVYANVKLRFSKIKKLKQKVQTNQKLQMAIAKTQAILSGVLKKHSYRLAVIASILALGAGSATVAVRAASCSSISDCQSQISNLQGQNNGLAAQVDSLQSQASSYQDAINILQQQISSVEASISANQAQQARLNAEIVELQQKIDLQKQLLGNDIRDMYVDGSMSSLEMLASSNNLSQYVDKQEYRNVVQEKIQSMLTQISELQVQVKNQKNQIDVLIATESNQQAQLAADQAQQNQLLQMNEAQQANYNSQIAANSSQIASLRSQQAALNRQLSSGGGRVIAGDPSHGGYPAYLDDAPQDSIVDPWGMYNRECVSYTAWKVQQTFGYVIHGFGNANQWPGSARAVGLSTGSTPRVHSVAIWNVGAYGHAMWVESVNSDGSIWVSQYNYDYQGHYSEMLVEPGMASSLTYIYF